MVAAWPQVAQPGCTVVVGLSTRDHAVNVTIGRGIRGGSRTVIAIRGLLVRAGPILVAARPCRAPPGWQFMAAHELRHDSVVGTFVIGSG